MPLSQPAPRKLMHNRVIECRGYEREDGLWDIEGHLVDTKPYATTARDTGQAHKHFETISNLSLRLGQISSGSRTGFPVSTARTMAMVVSRLMRACSGVVCTVGLPVTR